MVNTNDAKIHIPIYIHVVLVVNTKRINKENL